MSMLCDLDLSDEDFPEGGLWWNWRIQHDYNSSTVDVTLNFNFPQGGNDLIRHVFTVAQTERVVSALQESLELAKKCESEVDREVEDYEDEGSSVFEPGVSWRVHHLIDWRYVGLAFYGAERKIRHELSIENVEGLIKGLGMAMKIAKEYE